MKLNWLSIWRVLVPFVLLFTTVLLFWRHQYPLPPDAIGLLWLSRLDPLMLLAEWRTTGILPDWFWGPLGIAMLTIFLGRIFCGWICPLGGLLALLPFRHNRQPPHWLEENRYLWLLFLLILLLAGSNWPLFLSPFHLLTEEFTRLLQGKMIWLLGGMLCVGIGFFPRFWCTYICPTGLLLAFMSRWRVFRFVVGVDCSDCNACRKICPTQAVNPGTRRGREDCMLCGRCWQACPANEIHWQQAVSVRQPSSSPGNLSRRTFFKGGVALVAAGFSWQWLQQSAVAAVIRPPGAASEADFLAMCSRCGRCVKVCPSECLFPMPLEAGLLAFLTPRVIPRQARCDLCLLCQEVCPTGAIGHVPLAEVKMGVAVLDQRKCLVWSEKKVCLLCREQCPVQAIEMDEHSRPYVNEAKCVGCGACENGCPLKTAAIIVEPVENKG